jgi:hypothetical protein
LAAAGLEVAPPEIGEAAAFVGEPALLRRKLGLDRYL